MSDPQLKYLVQRNLISTIHLAVGSKLFQHSYVRRSDGTEFDAQDGGRLACAYVVSGILTLHMLIKQPHAEVVSTLKDLVDSGWVKTDKPVPGSIIHWPADDSGHEHIGFYLDSDSAMSNSDTERVPVLHSIIRKEREPIAYYTHPKLES